MLQSEQHDDRNHCADGLLSGLPDEASRQILRAQQGVAGTPCDMGGEIMKNFLCSFMLDESGASAAEYALILAVVGVGIGTAAVLLGNNIKLSVTNAAKNVYNCSNPSSTTTGLTPPANC